MTYRRKTWREKLADKPGYPKVLALEEGFPCYKALHRMGASPGDQVVLANPSEVVALMRLVPRGRVTTLAEICQRIARDHGVRACCTLTAGIFVMTAANAAAEAGERGEDMGVPYWRTLRIGGYLNEKYPGGTEAQARLLELEGHELEGRGRRAKVKDHQAKLFLP